MRQHNSGFPIAAGLFAGLFFWGCDRQQEGGPPPQMPPAEVAVITVSPQDVELKMELPGRTAGFRVAEIRPQVSGLLKKRLFTEGTEVTTTTELYQIDPAPFEAAIQSAQANVVSAQKAADRARAVLNASIANVARQKATVALSLTNRKRYEDLFKDKAVSASERDQAVTEADVAQATLHSVEAQVESDKAGVAAADSAIKQAEAARETTRINLGYTMIKAPIAGRIGRSNVTDGAMVNAYQTVMATVQQLDPIYIDVPQSTLELLRLKRRLSDGRISSGGDNAKVVTLMLEDGTEYPEKGELLFSDISVDPSTGSVILRIKVDNKKGDLLPGMFVRAIISEGIADNAIKVPQQAITRDPKGNPTVLIVGPDGKVQIRHITTERAIGDQWLVTAGLSTGDKVIVEGVQKVRPEMPVRTVPFVAPKPATQNQASTRPSPR